MTELCGFDCRDSSVVSECDCYEDCIRDGCEVANLGDGTCDESCNTEACGFDHGDCGYCASSCTLGKLLNGSCDAECSHINCFYDSSSCQECSTGCTFAKLGDGVCDSECNFSLCGFDYNDCSEVDCSATCTRSLLGNKQCDQECNSAECNYDDYDCLCALECLPSMLGDGTCDEKCNYKSCNYDNGDCVDQCSGTCSSDMVNNGICEEECWNKECSWDGSDCGCAANCRTEDLDTCDQNCLVQSCNYADPSCTDADLREFGRLIQMIYFDFTATAAIEDCPCTIEQMKTQCYLECNTPQCAYSWGLCSPQCNHCQTCSRNKRNRCLTCESGKIQFFGYCLDACPFGYETSSELCVLQSDSSTADSPYEYYVDANAGTSYGSGTLSEPFSTLSVALVSIFTKYSVLHLQGTGPFYLDELPSDYPLSDIANNKNEPLNRNNFDPVSLKIEGNNAEMVVKSSRLMVFYAKGKLELKDLTITSASLSDDCTGEFCNYCPDLECTNGICKTDQNEIITNYYQDCSVFHGFNLFTVEGSLVLSSVAFKDLRMEFNSLISLIGGDLEMQDVDFEKIKVRGDVSTAVITSVQRSDISYNTGNVLLLNDGYNFAVQNVNLNGFMLVDLANSITFESVNFNYNILYSSGELDRNDNALITIYVFDQLKIDNCEFSYNFLSAGAINLHSELISYEEYTLLENNAIYELSYNHFWVKDSKFSNNYVLSEALISAAYTEFLQNILFENLDFDQNAMKDATMISLVNNEMKAEYQSPTYIKTKVNTENKMLLYTIRTLAFRNVNISNCHLSSSGVFTLEKISYVNFDSVNINNNSNNPIVIDDILTNFFVSNPDSYIASLTNQEVTVITDTFAYIDSAFMIDWRNSDVSNNDISADNFLIFIGYTYSIQFDNITAEYNEVNCWYGALFLITRFLQFSVANSRFDNIANYSRLGSAAIFLDGEDESSISISNCVVSNNFAIYSAAVYCMANWLTVTDTVFDNNVNRDNLGAGLRHEINYSSADYTASIRNVTFEGNNAQSSNGGGLVIEDSSGASTLYLLEMEDCLFKNNSAYNEGSALYMTANIYTNSSSYIRNCLFELNQHYSGSLHINNKKGTLNIENCTFQENIGNLGAAMTYKGRTDYVLNITDSYFTRNSGNSIFFSDSSLGVNIVNTRNCLFENNEGIPVNVQYGNWTDLDSIFKHNTASLGVTITFLATSALQNTQIIYNTANRGGGVIVNNLGTLECTNCTISHNSATDSGGGICVETGTINIYDSLIVNNTAGNYGSAIYAYGAGSSISTVKNTDIYENFCNDKYTILLNIANLFMDNVKFHDNLSTVMKGGISIAYSNLTVWYSEFYNQEGDTGSLIQSDNSDIEIESSDIHDCTAAKYAAAIDATGSTIHIRNSNFRNIEAPIYSCFRLVSYTNIYLESTDFQNIFSGSDGIFYVTTGEVVADLITVDNYSGYGFFIISSDYVNITRSTFSRGLGNFGNALVISGPIYYVKIHDSNFYNTNSYIDGAAINCFSDTDILPVLDIANCNFTENHSINGGAVYTNNMKARIHGNHFENNTAIDDSESEYKTSTKTKGRGGGILSVSTIVSIPYDIQISNNTFISNSATYNGGGIAWENTIPSLSNNTFINNTAIYGPNVSSYPVTLKGIDESGNLTEYGRRLFPVISAVDGVNSGDYVPNSIRFALVDHYDQIVTSDSETTSSLEANSDFKISGHTSKAADNGIFVFDDFTVTADPDSEVFISVSSPTVQESDGDGFYNQALIQMKIRQCEIGESLVNQECIYCPQGTFSFDINEACEFCPENAICNGGAEMVPEREYWRSGKYSKIIWACPNPDACLGSPDDELSYTGVCETGYVGNLCQSCDKGLSRALRNTCVECPSSELNILRVVGVVAGMSILLTYMVKSTLDSAIQPTSLASVYMKIIVNYMQLLSFTTNINFTMPEYVKYFMTFQEAAGSASNQIFSFECFFEDYSNEKVFYLKIVIMSLLPFLLFVCALLFWSLLCLINRKISYLKEEMITTLIIMVNIVQTDVIKAMFIPLNCTDIEGEYYLVDDLDIKCWDKTHLYYVWFVAIPSIIVWGIGLTALLFYLLHHNRKKLNKLSIRKRYGFLFNGYTQREYYWELLIIFREIVIMFCSVIFTNVFYQSLTMMSILVGAYIMQQKQNPYTESHLNALESRSIMVSIVSIFCRLYFITGGLPVVIEVFFFTMMISSNLFFLIYWLKFMGKYVILVIVGMIPRLRNKYNAKVMDSTTLNLEERSPHIKVSGSSIQYVLNMTQGVKFQQIINPNATMNDLYLNLFYQSTHIGQLEEIQS